MKPFTNLPIWLSSVLEVVTNTVLLTVGLLVLAGFYSSWRTSQPTKLLPTTEAPPPYRSGDPLETTPGLDLQAGEKTLVAVLQSRCRYCTQSMAFYRNLMSKRSTTVRVVVISPEQAEVVEQYTAGHSFVPDTILSVNGLQRIRSTPTLILTDRTGTVRHIWTGLLTRDKESEVMAAVGLK